MKPHYRVAKIFIFTAIIVLAIIFFNAREQLGPFKQFSYWFFRYPQKILSDAGFLFDGIFNFVSEAKRLHNDKIFLTEENNRLRKEIFELKEARHENDLLRSALNIPLIKKHPIVDAEVIGKDPYSFLDFLVIGRGRDSNINSGMVVLDSNGFFIGKISEVYQNTAKIRTIADSASNISAIDQESRVQGLVKNDLGFGLIFDMVAQDEKVDVGDTIIVAPTSEDISVKPLAKVISVEKSPSKPFQKIKLFPMADIKNIEKVFIVLN